MARIFINGLKSKTGGGKNILDNYIRGLSSFEGDHVYYILTPNRRAYITYESGNIKIVDVFSLYKKNLFFPFLYFFSLPKLLKRHRIDLIFNFGDVIIPTRIKQIYFFDWAYAVYDESYIWNRMSIKDWLIRKAKVGLINKYIKSVGLTIAQTKNMVTRLTNKYGLQQVELIPTPVGNEFVINGIEHDFKLPQVEAKFLFPASFASHKNFEILISLGKLIRAQKLPYLIVITIEGHGTENLINNIRTEGLEKYILNIGKIDGSLMPSLYKQTDVMMLPTLLESFGLPYVEAMYYGKPIITSDMDFAHDVCGDAAIYFDPFDPETILQAMKDVAGNEYLVADKVGKGKRKVEQLPTWEAVLLKFKENIDLLLKY